MFVTCIVLISIQIYLTEYAMATFKVIRSNFKVFYENEIQLHQYNVHVPTFLTYECNFPFCLHFMQQIYYIQQNNYFKIPHIKTTR